MLIFGKVLLMVNWVENKISINTKKEKINLVESISGVIGEVIDTNNQLEPYIRFQDSYVYFQEALANKAISGIIGSVQKPANVSIGGVYIVFKRNIIHESLKSIKIKGKNNREISIPKNGLFSIIAEINDPGFKITFNESTYVFLRKYKVNKF